jgi:hypothetical protein
MLNFKAKFNLSRVPKYFAIKVYGVLECEGKLLVLILILTRRGL